MSESCGKILVVDDDQEMRISFFEALNSEGYNVAVAENGLMALDMLQKNEPDLIISDVKMPGLDGIELLKQVKVSHPNTPVIIVTGFASVDSAVDAMKVGAYDYILKPCPVEVIKQTAARALLQRDTAKSSGAEQAGTGGVAGGMPRKKTRLPKAIIGKDNSWLKVVERAKTVSSSKATVLLLGESGTGKEVLAQYIHNQSDRRDAPFVALNCAALPDGLLESELFGHEKGAFTGAVSRKKGKFELADHGTLLLDEIGEVPLHLQAKLLRVLQEEEVDRLGGKSPVKFDVHVLATTNRNLPEAVEKGEFRQDLYYRLNVIPLRLPALRDRKSDVLLLADYFIEKFSTFYKKEIKKLSQASAKKFIEYHWPGNVREMENMIERAVLLSLEEELQPWDIWDEEAPDGHADAPPGSNFESDAPLAGSTAIDSNITSEIDMLNEDGEMVSLRKMERQMILRALQKTDNNRTHAAKMLGISVRTLRNKLNEYRSKGLAM